MDFQKKKKTPMTNAERIKMDHMTGWRQEKIKGQLKEETDESKSWTGIQWIKKKNQKTENKKTVPFPYPFSPHKKTKTGYERGNE